MAKAQKSRKFKTGPKKEKGAKEPKRSRSGLNKFLKSLKFGSLAVLIFVLVLTLPISLIALS